MRGSNRLRVAASLCWLIHIVVILAAKGQVRIVLSDCVQFVIGVLTVVACLLAARRSRSFGKIFWHLAGTGFALLTLGLALATISEGFQALTHHSWIIDLFVNAWTAPLVMCLFLDPEAEADTRDWRRILDFAQVGIVFVLLYLYSSNFAMPGAGFEPWRLALATDLLISAGFFLRGFTLPPGPARKLFLRFGYFRTVSVITDAVFVLGMPEPGGGDVFDLVWSITLVIPIMIAAAWQDSRDAVPAKRAPSSSHWRLLTTQLMPLIFPLLVMIMASQIVRGQLVVAAAAVLASLFITFIRLWFTQREQEQSAEALRQSHRLLQSIMEGANEVIFVKDLNGRYLMINTPGARMLGRTVPDVVGKTDADIFPEEVARFITKVDSQVIESRKAMTYDLNINLAGVSYTFLSTKSPYFGPQGQLIGLIGVSLDITDRRRLEDQLRQTQKMEAIGTLTGGIAHDFNNLLTVIKGYTGLVLDATNDAALRALVGHIDQAADRASALTRQLLAYSRRQVLQPRVINLGDLVLNLDKMLQRLIGEDVVMKTVVAANLGSVKADPGQIEQVIMNLAVNARDAMPKGGSLTLETANADLDDAYARKHEGVRPGRYVMLAVSDTGTGMDSFTQSHMFEPFFTTKGVGRGTGLGLSMAYGIVKQSDGSIEVYSEPGHGTTFKIYLPRVEEPVAASPGKPAATANGGTETILLVEDDEQVRELTDHMLANCGYTVLRSDSLASALAHCERHTGTIHLLLTDVIMPKVGGREVASQVMARRPGIKVLYMSGYTPNAIVHHGVLDEGTYFLQKPFTPAALAAKVREILDQPSSKP